MIYNFPELKQHNTQFGRFYETPDGNYYPSITTVLSSVKNESLEQWRKSVGEEEANRISKLATTRGTYIHKYAEHVLKNEPFEYRSIFDKLMFTKMLPIVKEFTDVRCIETKLYSDYLKSAGTVDVIGKFRKKLSVGDWKTSNNLKYKSDIDGYFMQTAAYAVMFEERTKIPITQLVICIAVEEDEPQLFIEHRDNWISSYIEIRNKFTYNEKQVIIDTQLDKRSQN